jgi:hypothetical protein
VSTFENELRTLGVEWPPTPDLVAAIEPRLAAQPRRRRGWLRPAAIALATLVVALGAVLALSPGARSAFLELFHLKGVTVVRVEELPQPRPVRPLALGEQVTFAEAQRRAGFELVKPEELGDPDEIHERRGFVTFVYRADGRPRLIFSQLRADISPFFVKKVAQDVTRIQTVSVRVPRDGLFLSGGPHELMFTAPNNETIVEPVFLAGTTLLWERGPLTLRLEGDLTLRQALELARSVK